MDKYNNFNQQPKRGYVDLINYGGFLARFWVVTTIMEILIVTVAAS
nr:hypothetical protein [Clostridium botulinum]